MQPKMYRHLMNLGAVPAISSRIRVDYPIENISLWQAGAKKTYRDLLEELPVIGGDDVLARRMRLHASLACMALAWHLGAPATAREPGRIVPAVLQAAMSAPIFGMLVGSMPLARDGITGQLGSVLGASDAADVNGWHGSCEHEGDVLRVHLDRCPIRTMAARHGAKATAPALCYAAGLAFVPQGMVLRELSDADVRGNSYDLVIEPAGGSHV